MAEAALFGIAKSVLKQLGSPALDEFRLLWGQKEQFEKLEDTVTTVRNVLQDADRKHATDAAVQGWLARLRALLYEADDLFDVISAKFLLEKNKKGSEIGKKVGHFLSKPYQFAFFVKNAHKVKKIRERFDDIARDIQRFNFLPNQSDVAPMSRIGREPTHSFIPRNEVVGREQETEDVVRMLLFDCSQQQQGGVSVIAVIGIGGLGKTTLAQLVYNDDRVQKGFDLCMWACVNYFSHLKQVVITLLKSATIKEPENLDIDQLQSKLRKEIEGKRFLLVLDDVWDEDPQNWRRLKQLLSGGKDGSKVLATIRSKIVVQTLCATKPYFDLKGMSDESAWLLFQKLAFGEDGDQNSSEFEQLGRQIVRKCANVPLAIVTVASLLREKDKERWFPLVNDELSKVIPDEYKKVTHVLEFSYNELPYPVKRCFGICSLFPKDCVFSKDSLICLWIAQGFIEPLNNQSPEDRAEEYLFYLVNKCFFQADHRYETLGQVTYQMHDLMHDLATTVARSETVLIDQIEYSSWDKNVRHVSSCYQPKSMVDSVCSFSHSKSLRTFLYPHRYNDPCIYKDSEENISLGKNDLKKLMSAFRSLRVLDLSDLGIEKVPTSVGELIHLRFLNLSRNYMRRLPSSICSLPHLQYLVLQMCKYLKELPEELGDLVSLRFLNLSFRNRLERLPSSVWSLPHLQSLILEGCYYLKELPDELGDLLSLRHLVLEGCSSLVKMPPGLAALTSLVTLDRLVVHNPSGGLKYLEGLDNLTGSLRIELPETEWENSKMDAERSFLSRKSRLRALEIIHMHKSVKPATTVNTGMNAIQPPPDIVNLRISYFGGKEMPQWVSCLQKLVFLKLYMCDRCTALPSLSLLPSLKELNISDMSSMVAIEDSMFYEPHSFFPSLETLLIMGIPNLTSWWL